LVDRAIETNNDEVHMVGIKQKKQKCIHPKENDRNLPLGEDIQFDSAMEVSKHILVHQAKGNSFRASEIYAWIKKTWDISSVKIIEVIILARGWFMLQF